MKFMILAVMSLGLLSACVPDFKDARPATLQYVLHPADHMPAVSSDISLRIMTPHLANGLDTDKIAVLQEQRTLRYVEQGRWAGRLDEVLLQYMYDTLDSVEGMTAVKETDYLIYAKHYLMSDVTAFQAEYDTQAGEGVPVMHITIRFRVIEADSGQVVYQQNVDTVMSAETNTTTAMVSALETLMHQAMHKLLQGMVVSVVN